MSQLILSELSKAFGDKRILDRTSLVFESGKIYGLLGRNGSGKTTLFNLIAKNLRLDSGTISLQVDDPAGDQAGDAAAVPASAADYDSTQIGFVQTLPSLPAFMTGYEFVRYFLEIHRESLAQLPSPDDCLAQVGIEPADRHLLMRDYSHGMRNKVQMLVSLIAQPPVLLLDEPLTSFDPVAAHEMKQLLRSAKTHSIIIFSTHILALAQDLCDDIILLHHQQLEALDSADLHRPDFEEKVVSLLSDEAEGEDH